MDDEWRLVGDVGETRSVLYSMLEGDVGDSDEISSLLLLLLLLFTSLSSILSSSTTSPLSNKRCLSCVCNADTVSNVVAVPLVSIVGKSFNSILPDKKSLS